MTRTPAEIRDLFDAGLFGGSVRACAAALGLSVREAAKEAGCSPATFNRVCRGNAPDVENYLRLEQWLRQADALAPLAAERGEVVTWRAPQKLPFGKASWHYLDASDYDPATDMGYEPLYAHPASPAPAAMPGVEEIRKTILDILYWSPDVSQSESDSIGAAARTILALFQPLAQENERLKAERDELKGKLAARMDYLVSLATTADRHAIAAAEARALSAEQALAEAGERYAAICDTQSPNMPDREDHSAEYCDGFSDGADAAAFYFAAAIRSGETG